MKKPETLYIVIPCYNEEEVLEETTKQLKVKNTRKKVTWKSSRPKIATVTKTGKIKAKRKGTSIITATVGKKKLRCTVKVIAKKKTSTTTATTEQQPDVMEQTTKDDGWTPGWY